MTIRLIIHAPNVHQGGGAALLLPLLTAIGDEMPCAAVVDRRLRIPGEVSRCLELIRVEPAFRARLGAERMLARISGPNDTVLCFGNLPPLFRLRSKIVVFIQNRYLVESTGLHGFPWRIRLRISLERFWLRRRASSVSEFIVQTPSMKQALENAIGREAIIRPFAEAASGHSRKVRTSGKNRGPWRWDFLYVASGEPHKNHRNLIKAWCLLAKEEIRPSLCLTIPDRSSPQLMGWIEDMKAENDLKIENQGSATAEEIQDLYKQSHALIYPSTCESLGLPLIEARNNGLPVLASELDYVRDVLDPEQGFDPTSPVSIARAVKRHMGLEESQLPLISAREFIQALADPPD